MLNRKGGGYHQAAALKLKGECDGK